MSLRKTIKLNQVKGGAWFPIETDLTSSLPDSDTAIIYRTMKIDLEKSAFNDISAIPPEVFEIEITNNMKIHDHRSGKSLRYTKDMTPLVMDELQKATEEPMAEVHQASTLHENEQIMEPEELRLFLLKGYAAAKSVLEDVRIEYQTKSFQDHDLNREFLGPVFIKELEEIKKIKIPEGSSTTYKVEEYIQKNGNEIWFVYPGDEAPTQDMPFSMERIRTKDSRFRVFDGQYTLDYYSAKDGITQVGRATLDVVAVSPKVYTCLNARI